MKKPHYPQTLLRPFHGVWIRLSRVCGKGFPLGVDKGGDFCLEKNICLFVIISPLFNYFYGIIKKYGC